MSSFPKRVIKVRGPISGVKIISTQNMSNPEPTEMLTGTDDAPAVNGNTAPVEYLQIAAEEFQQELAANYQRGFEEGKVEGYQEAETRLGKVIENFQLLLQTLEAEREKLFREYEDTLLELIFKMSEKIVGALSESGKDLIETTLKGLLKNLSVEGKIKILVNPDDHKAMQEMVPRLKKSITGLEDLRIIADPGITRGGCIIDGSNAKLDARLETRLAEMQRQLTKIATAVEKSQS